jgi:HlyD family secretion protein
MNTSRFTLAAAVVVSLATACKKQQAVQLYEPVPVARRDIIVSAEANGSVQPIQIVDVKSRASGQILEMRVETGDMVHRGDTLVKVDRRDPTTAFNQAQADLEVAQAQAANATAQKRRADEMFAAGVLSEQDHDNSILADANARAQLVRAQAGLQSAQDALTDCNVLAPVDGTILTKKVEAGAVITSAVRDVSGGTVLLQMADLSTVQVSALVDETDIGKVQPGMVTTITVDAYPNRPFQGTVLKIEPQSTVSQNVTMFAVLAQIPNPGGLLRPGMNAEVAVQIGERQGVLAIPTSALRTPRDVSSAAQVLGLEPKEVDRQLAMQDSVARANPQLASAGAPGRGSPADPPRAGAARAVEGGNVSQLRAAEASRAAAANSTAVQGAAPQRPTGNGQMAAGPGGAPGGFQLPPGVTQEQMSELRRKRMANETLTAQDSVVMLKIRQWREQQGAGQGFGAGGQSPAGGAAQGSEQNGAGAEMQQLRAIFQKQRSGQQLTPQEQAIMQQAMRRFQQGGATNGQSRPRFGEGNNYQYGGSFIVFVLKGGKPAPVRVRTGLTDMDYSEVLNGLSDKDTVLLLPSASLVQSQAEMRDRMQRFAGSAVPGMQQGSRTGAAGGPGPRAGGR